ncbi:hypothetical protein GQ43DRAFT_268391 [Delitschia confertaspora ATCC 74209]|uniref:C2H2-type domain-containing protein n=1 Tax=Delitschia confertaspora ATCC 74209 TaxID=1513339 RepID=A0A9P4JB29_9PLEO|nr:hypothetical protein GQ43DRAFT_268391 [Delitschia confertaspora ATCC 74209]
MDGRQSEYSQSGLSSPYPIFAAPNSEGSSADPASAAQYPQGQDPRAATYSSSATPASEYNNINSSSARSGSFPEYIQRSYQPAAQGASAGGMAQPQSPSMHSPEDGHNQNNGHPPQQTGSDSVLPIDPSIAAAASPTYPGYGQQHSPYTPQHDIQHYPAHAAPMYSARPEWASGQYPQHHMGYAHPVTSGAPAPAMVSPVQRPPPGGHPLSTVYSFVPIPGAQQHKRPRRRYEEIERMYKCGWNGCEKAYGTLNHLNAHVTMQSHGNKRTPEEFKEIRKEWKAKKKEEEAARKAEEERQRAAEGRPAHEAGSDAPVYSQIRQMAQPGTGAAPQLPPIGYQPANTTAGPQYGTASPGIQEGMAHSYPQSPYGQNPQIYQQGP